MDFVANCERLILVREIIQQINEIANTEKSASKKDALQLSGNAYDFIFTNEQLDIFEIINRINAMIYLTWQEASKVVIAAGIKTGPEYLRQYKVIDPRLPGAPSDMYSDFPGWGVFLGTGRQKRSELYKTWQEASAIAIENGISNIKEYKERYKIIHTHLPSNPNSFYNDFPNWYVFLGKKTKK